MKAWVLHGINDIRWEEVKEPERQPGWSFVRVAAAGICGSDIPRIFTTGAHRHPLIPGHEFSGTVVSGERFPEGTPVGIFPLIPDLTCDQCRKKRYEMCRNYNYLGSRCDGGFAEYCLVPDRNLMELPRGVTLEQAAMLEPMSVAMHAVRMLTPFREEGRRVLPGMGQNETIPTGIPGMMAGGGRDILSGKCAGSAEKNEEIPRTLVIGLGTIGLFSAMHLIAMGYLETEGVGKSDFQREQFLKIGGRPENYHEALPGGPSNPGSSAVAENAGIVGNGGEDRNVEKDDIPRNVNEVPLNSYDYVLECVGREETIRQAVEAAAPGGEVVFVGNPASDIGFPRDVYWEILRKELTIHGTWNSSYLGPEDPEAEQDDWHRVLLLLSDGSIRPERLISHRFPLEELDRGLAIMHEKTEPYTKVMIRMDHKGIG